MLLAGVRDFPAQMGSGSTSSNFTAEARFGVQWLLKMWNDQTRTLYYQVGIGNGNAKTVSATTTSGGCRRPTTRTAGRPARTGTSDTARCSAPAPPGAPVSPNLAGRMAAAFAMCFQVYRTLDADARIEVPARRRAHLRAGRHLAAGHLLTLIPFSFYPETEWRDDLELGATELAMALGSRRAARPGCRTPIRRSTCRGPRTGPTPTSPARRRGDTLNLYDVSGFAHYDLYRAIQAAGDPAGLEVTRAAAAREHEEGSSTAPLAQGATDPFGFGFSWAQWDTTTHGAGLSVMASEYDAAHRHVDLRRPRGRVARQHPGRERLGLVADRRRRQGVPGLHPPPGREHRGASRRHGAGAQRRRGRGTERHRPTGARSRA